MQNLIGIIGLGLIGGSLALTLAAQNKKVVAIVQNPSEILAKHNFELVTNNLEALNQCDLVFICTPLNSIPALIQTIQPYLKSNCCVSDVGSVKSFICQTALNYMRPDCSFIGGHPMAGTEKAGFENAFAELFEGKTWALIGNNLQNNLLTNTIESTGAKIIWTKAAEHDKAVSLISHLPLMLSMGLFNTLENLADPEIKKLAQSLASSGFAGMTRLAKGNSELNHDLLHFNQAEIKLAYNQFMIEVERIQKNL